MTLWSVLLCAVLLGTVYEAAAWSGTIEEKKMSKAVDAATFLYNLVTEQAKAQGSYYSHVAAGFSMEAAAAFPSPEEPKEAGPQYKNRYFYDG